MMLLDFTPELIAGLVGMALSWLFGWFPGLNTWYASLKSEIKSVIMLTMLGLASVIVYFLAINGVIQTETPITVWKLLSVFFVATTISQTTYTLTPLNRKVDAIKTERTIDKITNLEKPVG